jgi:adenylosuccinate lyase
MCSLARFTLALAPAASQTAATQWLERTLDDSAIRRLVIPQAFLAVDAILNLYLNIAPGLVVHPAVIEGHVARELPFMATENLLMAAVQSGGDRQDLHERIRGHAIAASEQLKAGGARNDLLDRIQSDPALPRLDFERMLDAGRYTGRSAQQVDEFVANLVEPIRRRYPSRGEIDPDSAIRV